MPQRALVVAVALIWAGTVSGVAAGQVRFVGDTAATEHGQGLFNNQCATCHGPDARGVTGPDLMLLLASGRSDDSIFQTIRRGVPGTAMPAAGRNTSDDDIWKIIAYLRTLNAPVPETTTRGDPAKGEQVFSQLCVGCHRVNERGGSFGPDLTRIGASLPRAVLVNRIRGEAQNTLPGYAPVTLILPDGRRIDGVRKNEDIRSVQIMDRSGRIQGFLKSDLRQVMADARSAMPSYSKEQLSESALDDLIRYLSTLRGTVEPGAR